MIKKCLLWTIAAISTVFIGYLLISIVAPLPSRIEFNALASDVDTNKLLQIQMNKTILKEIREMRSDIRLLLGRGNYVNVIEGSKKESI